MIDIEHVISTKGKAGQLSQDTNGLLTEYTKDDEGLLSDNTIQINNGVYDGLDDTSWKEKKSSSVTSGKVSLFKIKNKIGLGAYGLYSIVDEDDTVIKVPIDMDGKLPAIDGIEVVDNGDYINYKLLGNTESYDNVRLEFTRGLRTHDFMVSTKAGDLIKPFDMDGEFEVSCIGYKNEIQEFSNKSKPIIVNILKKVDE